MAGQRKPAALPMFCGNCAAGPKNLRALETGVAQAEEQVSLSLPPQDRWQREKSEHEIDRTQHDGRARCRNLCCTASTGPETQSHCALDGSAPGCVFLWFQNHPGMRKVARLRPGVKMAWVTNQVHYLGLGRGTGKGSRGGATRLQAGWTSVSQPLRASGSVACRRTSGRRRAVPAWRHKQHVRVAVRPSALHAPGRLHAERWSPAHRTAAIPGVAAAPEAGAPEKVGMAGWLRAHAISRIADGALPNHTESAGPALRRETRLRQPLTDAAARARPLQVQRQPAYKMI